MAEGFREVWTLKQVVKNLNDTLDGGTTGQVLAKDSSTDFAYTWQAPAGGAEVNDLTAAVTWANIPIANVPTGVTSVTVALGDHLHDSIADTNLLDKSANEIITLPAGGEWTFVGDGTGKVSLDDGTDLVLESNDGTTTASFNHNNTDVRFVCNGTRYSTLPFLATGFLDFRSDQPIKIKEQAAADADVSTYGQLWVKTATPNQLWFTDDGGTDVQLGIATSELVTTTNIITASESGKTFYLNLVGGFTSTLPAPAIGLKYKFIVKTAPTTAYIITTNAGANVLYGFIKDTTGADPITYFSAQDQLDFVASKSPIGDTITVESDGTNWYCECLSGADGGITVAVT